MAAKTGYWRITTKAIAGAVNFVLYDHLPNGTARTNLDVKVQIPGKTAYLDLTEADLGSYDAANPHSFTLDIAPGDVADETAASFRDGIYKFKIVYEIGADTYTFEEYFLHIPVIDKCISDKLDTYLKSMCNLCKEQKQLQTLQELVTIRQGVLLDIGLATPPDARVTSANEKITLLDNICKGNGCTCVCGC
jgi:hypothetical protein